MRTTCYRCFWPTSLCWCGSIHPMATRTRFVFLMHPKEFKQEKAATGRLTHLCLTHSELHVGIGFDAHAEVQALLHDPNNLPFLLYPGPGALNLSDSKSSSVSLPSEATGTLPRARSASGSATLSALNSQLSADSQLAQQGFRQLVVILLDATWALGRKMLKLSPSLQRLPRLMFTPTAPSRYLIKQQPHPACLSTLEATHELLLALERAGLDRYPLPDQLLGLFQRMQDFQLRCASDPTRTGYRHRAYRPPAERKPVSGRSGSRRTRLFDRL